jgi:hypothetical protein
VDLLTCADGIVYNSEDYKDAIVRNGIKTTANETTLYPFANKKFYKTPETRKGGVVYQGSIISPYLSTSYEYRNIVPILDAFKEMEIKIHVFPNAGREAHAKDYIRIYHKFQRGPVFYEADPTLVKDNYVFFYNSAPYEKLIGEMGNYHWGFVGTHIKESYMNYVMPHKLFDYMAAGIPIMVMNMRKTAEFVEREGVGVVINDFSDIKKYYPLWKEKQKVVMEVRDKWAMENHINKVTTVFEEALKGGKE